MPIDQKQARQELSHDLERSEQVLNDLIAVIDSYLTQIPDGEYFGTFALAHLRLENIMREASRLKHQAENARLSLAG